MKLRSFLALGLVVGIFGALYGAAQYGESRGRAEEQAACAAERQRAAEEIAALVEQARQTEREHSARVLKLAEIHSAQRREIQHEADTVIADIDNGALRLRDELRACEAQLPENPAAAGGGHAAPGGGRATDIDRDVVRAGRKADEAIADLNALQQWAREALAVCGPHSDGEIP